MAYIGLYGSVGLTKERCRFCHTVAFVLDGKLACCGSDSQEKPEGYKRESLPDQARKLPPAKAREYQLAGQDYRCFYCERSFDSLVYRNNAPVKLRLQWDHYVPYAYSQNNSASNFVAACHVCNSIKTDLCFLTVDEAKTYVHTKLQEKGYSDAPASNGMRVLQNKTSAQTPMAEVLQQHMSNPVQESLRKSTSQEPSNHKSSVVSQGYQPDDRPKQNQTRRTGSHQDVRKNSSPSKERPMKSKQPLSYNDALRERLIKYQSENNLSNAETSRRMKRFLAVAEKRTLGRQPAIGVGQSTIYGYVSKKWLSSQAALERFESRLSGWLDPPHVETINAIESDSTTREHVKAIAPMIEKLFITIEAALALPGLNKELLLRAVATGDVISIRSSGFILVYAPDVSRLA